MTHTETKIRQEVEALQDDLKNIIEVCLTQKQSISEALDMTENLRESALCFRKATPRKRHLWSRLKKHVFIFFSEKLVLFLVLTVDIQKARRC